MAATLPGPAPGWQLPDPRLAPALRRTGPRNAHRLAEAEPTVHITIGQVEIRADRGAAARPARPAGKPRRVAPELSEYLQQRGRRR
jgi:hypothetical protein